MGGDHDGRLTSRTIATLSGVSQTTVSRVLAGHPNVSETTRSKVLGVLAETGYTPNAAAQAMRRRRSGMLGVVVGRVTNPFFPELAEALHLEITRRGLLMNLWISDGGEDDAGERAALDTLRRRAIDGIVYTTATPTSPSLREALGGAAPVVLLNRTLPGVAADSVSSDNAGGAVALARHFLALGHRRSGWSPGSRASPPARSASAGSSTRWPRRARRPWSSAATSPMPAACAASRRSPRPPAGARPPCSPSTTSSPSG